MATASWVLGSLLLVFLILVYCVGPRESSQLQDWILGLISAFLAGLFGYFLMGDIAVGVEGELSQGVKTSIQAAGGAGAFMLVFVIWHERRRPVKPEGNGLGAGGGDSALVNEILDRLEKTQDELRQERQEKERLQEELVHAARRLATSAEAGQPEAHRAIEALRASGDPEKLLVFLAIEEDRIPDEALEIGREIAAVALLAGKIDEAETALQKILAVQPGNLNAISSMGSIHELRGSLDDAEQAYRRVLEKGAASRDEAVVAIACRNLGSIYQTRGDLDRAEELFRKSLDLNDRFGRLHGKATDCGNLGIIYMERGDLDWAEEMCRKSLKISEKLGSLEDIASQYLNLGIIYETRGDLDRAEEMRRKLLKIAEKSGNLVGMAGQYHNLGIIYQKRGDPDEARRLWTKARDIYARVGMLQMKDKVQGWIDGLDSASPGEAEK